MKDRIGNELAAGDKVMVVLPESQIFGFVSQIDEPGLIAVRGGTKPVSGRLLVSCVIALPVMPENYTVLQCVKVYDADKHESDVTERTN
jgi:hypothetical protein